MKNNFLIAIAAMVTLASCGGDKDIESENAMLKKQNDSLKSVLDSLHKKYIFDFAFVKHIPSSGNTNKPGSRYRGEFFYVAYNDEDAVLFRSGKNEMIDTLTVKPESMGTYKFETTLGEDKTDFYFNPLIRDKDAVQSGNMGYHGTTIKDKNRE